MKWNLTGSCGQQQRLRGWSRMMVKQFQDGGRPPFWKSLYRHISAKNYPISMKFCTQQQILKVDERHVIKNEKVALDRLRVRVRHNTVISLQPRGYIAEWLRFFRVVVEGPKGCLPAAQFSCDMARDPQTCPKFHLWQMAIPKDVWKRAILISSTLPPKLPQNPILADLLVQTLL